MRTWYSAVILSIHEKGASKVSLQDIYAAIDRYRALSDHDRDISYEQENYKHTVRSCLKALQKANLVDYLGKAIYSLTPKALENIHLFEADETGSRVTTKAEINEFLRRLGLLS